MFDKKRYLVTSALPYANGPLHIGHLCGAYIPADIFVRYLRIMGKDVAFIGGSDENGAAITLRAKKECKNPQEIIDYYHELFKKSFSDIGISFDYYDRTSAKHHHEVSQAYFSKLYDKGSFVEKESEQYFDETENVFLADRYITGECPNCHFDKAYGDQCENCGNSLSPLELINPISTVSGNAPILKKTTHWYLPLDRHEQWLREWIENGQLDGKEHHDPTLWKSHVIGQCKSWLDAGLHERSMTRDLDWGIDVPKEIPGSEGKKLYVWLDAPIGYISSTIQWAQKNNKNWEDYWKKDDAALIHFIGKDNIVFHCLIFPVLLKEHGDYNLPVNVPANQFLNLEGEKFSTSRNWAIWVHEFINDFPEWKDELRYYLTKNMPEQRDSEFTWNGFQDATNNELVNNLGNFVNRVIVLLNKYYDGVIPEADDDIDVFSFYDPENMSYYDAELLSLFDMSDAVCNKIRKFDFRGALKDLMTISSSGNQFLQFNEPWKNFKENPDLVRVVMNISVQFTAVLSILTHPFMPWTSDKIRGLLNMPKINGEGELLEALNTLAEGGALVEAGHKIGEPVLLFKKIEDEIIEEQINKLKATDPDVVGKEVIEYDDFSKLELRTGRIIEAAKIEKTDKLLKLTVDLGYQKRTVVSGIAEHYTPKGVINQKVVLVANLAPRKIRGVESHGMILMATDDNGQMSFVQDDKTEMPLGSEIS